MDMNCPSLNLVHFSTSLSVNMIKNVQGLYRNYRAGKRHLIFLLQQHLTGRKPQKRINETLSILELVSEKHDEVTRILDSIVIQYRELLVKYKSYPSTARGKYKKSLTFLRTILYSCVRVTALLLLAFMPSWFSCFLGFGNLGFIS